jgi:ABC-type transporter Mla MlaB component
LLPDRSNSGVWLLEGPLTLATAGTLQQKFDSAVARKESPGQLDVSGLTGVDAAGLGCLYTLQCRGRTPLEIVCTSPQVRTLFQAHRAEVLLGASVDPLRASQGSDS